MGVQYILNVLGDVVRTVWRLPEDIRAQRLLTDGLMRHYRHHCARKRFARRHEPREGDDPWLND